MVYFLSTSLDNPSLADYVYDYYNFPQMFDGPSEYHQDQTNRAYSRERMIDIIIKSLFTTNTQPTVGYSNNGTKHILEIGQFQVHSR